MATLETFSFETPTGVRLVGDELPGEGRPWVFFHGLGSERQGTKGAALLEHARRRGRRLLRFDFRGHGASGGVLEDATLSDLCEDARSVLGRVDQPAYLIGSSLGGLVAAWTAARHSDRCAGLALIAPAFGVVHKLQPSASLVVAAPGTAVPMTIGAHVVEDASRFDEASLAERLSMPVFAVHGSSDDVIAAEHTSTLIAQIPHQTKDLWLVPDGDHGLVGHVDTIIERLAAFEQVHCIG